EEAWITKGTTIEEALDKNNVEINKLDKVSPALTEEAEEDTEITITRVEEKEEVVEEAIAFKTIEKKDNTLNKGQSKVLKSGKEGKAKKTYTVTFENGQEVSRELIDEETIEKSVAKEVAVGTKE